MSEYEKEQLRLNRIRVKLQVIQILLTIGLPFIAVYLNNNLR
jgi:hypothetical protein